MSMSGGMGGDSGDFGGGSLGNADANATATGGSMSGGGAASMGGGSIGGGMSDGMGGSGSMSYGGYDFGNFQSTASNFSNLSGGGVVGGLDVSNPTGNFGMGSVVGGINNPEKGKSLQDMYSNIAMNMPEAKGYFGYETAIFNNVVENQIALQNNQYGVLGNFGKGMLSMVLGNPLAGVLGMGKAVGKGIKGKADAESYLAEAEAALPGVNAKAAAFTNNYQNTGLTGFLQGMAKQEDPGKNNAQFVAANGAKGNNLLSSLLNQPTAQPTSRGVQPSLASNSQWSQPAAGKYSTNRSPSRYGV